MEESKEYERLGALIDQVYEDFHAGRCRHLSASTMNVMVNYLSRIVAPDAPLSKEQAAAYFHISPRQFDRYVALGRIPAGKKIRGFTNKVWYRSALCRVDISRSANS